jgi:hypothetical protein
MQKSIIKMVIWVLSIFMGVVSYAQTAEITLGRQEMGYHETFSITLTMKGARISEYSAFPDFPDLIKKNISNSTSTEIVDNQVRINQSVIQYYLPAKDGNITVRPFSMTVNGITVNSRGTTLKVSKQTTSKADDPFADFWDAGRKSDSEYTEVADEAFFSVSVDKREIFLGEGFLMTISFYISLRDKAKIEFYKINDQLAEILKVVKPENCWEENYGIDQINPEYVTLNGQQFTQYKIYQSVFFPLSAENITIPPASLKMLKFKVAKNPSFFGNNLKEDFKTYTSKASRVVVKPLPEHPLKSLVNVGVFKMKESLSELQWETGKSYNYTVEISGEGNIASLKEPILAGQDVFEYLSPVASVRLNKTKTGLQGAKTFRYQLQAKEPGVYPLGDFFQWVYFNPVTKKYETLKSDLTIEVTGESRKNMEIAGQAEPEGFYSMMFEASNSLKKREPYSLTIIFANITLVAVLACTVLVVLTRSRQAEKKKKISKTR